MTVLDAAHRPPTSPLDVLGYSSPLLPATSRSGELFRSLFERSGVGIAVLDGGCRIQRANADLLSILDRDAAEVEGLEFSGLLPTECRRRLLNSLDGLRAGRERRFGEHVQVRRPDGSAAEGHLTAVPLRVSGADPTAIMILLVRSRKPVAPEPAVASTKVLSEVDARILEGVAAGASTVQMAGQLFLSRQGVEYHVSAMLRRLKAPNRPALVSRAYKLGILSAGTWPPRADPQFVY
ncbi:PAS domain S-box protein [Actinoplanes sp. LDG1-06]|uniref:PAS domain S-box protein n=1 Tax=Paractinoplanes ovalisporus TaxID=2810368 RepID=A0ABS2AIS5_9ACTN|nr:LuxR C-terminal-related transcriptional regulator [Actinoplanes ovalisporus]MBM2619683.1 PAS domain S-box protein [Actinoplanes ovalisporus]